MKKLIWSWLNHFDADPCWNMTNNPLWLTMQRIYGFSADDREPMTSETLLLIDEPIANPLFRKQILRSFRIVLDFFP